MLLAGGVSLVALRPGVRIHSKASGRPGPNPAEGWESLAYPSSKASKSMKTLGRESIGTRPPPVHFFRAALVRLTSPGDQGPVVGVDEPDLGIASLPVALQLRRDV